LFSSQRVSPVVVFFKPTAAAISPEYATGISSLWLACIRRILPILSFWSLTELRQGVPAAILPEYTRKKQILPTNGSVAILNARAENGSSSEE